MYIRPFEEDPETFEYNEIGIDQPTNVTEEFGTK